MALWCLGLSTQSKEVFRVWVQKKATFTSSSVNQVSSP